MIKTVCTYFFIFMIYSIFGWIVETLLYAIRDKKLVKRGFLFGPLCPIYGFGAVICTAILYGRVSNIALIFVYGLLICGALEYITHFLLEKIFHAVWWDYSDRRFNIKGRVYLKGLLFFGAGAVLIVKVLQPLVFAMLSLISNTLLYVICFVLYSILIIDIATTLSDLLKTVNEIKSIQAFAISKIQKGMDVTDDRVKELVESVKETSFVVEMTERLNRKGSLFSKMQRISPNFTLQHYKHVIDMISDRPDDEKKRTDVKHYGTADSIPTANDSDDKTSAE